MLTPFGLLSPEMRVCNNQPLPVYTGAERQNHPSKYPSSSWASSCAFRPQLRGRPKTVVVLLDQLRWEGFAAGGGEFEDNGILSEYTKSQRPTCYNEATAGTWMCSSLLKNSGQWCKWSVELSSLCAPPGHPLSTCPGVELHVIICKVPLSWFLSYSIALVAPG